MTAATPPRRQMNIRLPPDLLEQIEADSGKKQEIVEDALRAWFAGSSENGDDSTVLSSDNKNDSIMIAALTGQLDEKDRQIAAKDRQISELHILMLQPQLPPAPEAQKEGRRRWWQFWRQKA